MKTNVIRASRYVAWVLGILGIAACSATVDGGETVAATHTALSAKSADENTQLFRVRNGDGVFPLLATNGKGYRFSCADGRGLSALIQGAGFDAAIFSMQEEIALNSPELQELFHTEVVKMDDIGVLRCKTTAAQGALVSIRIGETTQYFVDLNESDGANKRILRNVGCGQLLRAMGFDVKKAVPLDRTIAELWFRIDDAFDIHCAAGTPPSDYIPRLKANPMSQAADRGRAIQPVTFTLENVAPGAAATLSATADDCGFLTITGMTVSGRVDPAFTKSSCSATYVARGTDFETTPVTVTFDTAIAALTCDPGHADCNGSFTDGCETMLDTTANCGTCGARCASTANATAVCVSGACGNTCNPGWGNCNGADADGCEAALDTTANCGVCGNACSSGANATAACVSGSCKTTCTRGWAECNGSAADGCETYVDFDANNCGACGNRCAAGQSCKSGVCKYPPQCGPERFKAEPNGVLFDEKTGFRWRTHVTDDSQQYCGYDVGGCWLPSADELRELFVSASCGANTPVASLPSGLYWTSAYRRVTDDDYVATAVDRASGTVSERNGDSSLHCLCRL